MSATVKNRLKLFEQGSDQDANMSGRPAVANKPVAPVLQMFKKRQDEAAAGGGAESGDQSPAQSANTTSNKPPILAKGSTLGGGAGATAPKTPPKWGLAAAGQQKSDVNQNVVPAQAVNKTGNKAAGSSATHQNPTKVTNNGVAKFGAATNNGISKVTLKPAVGGSSSLSSSSSSSSTSASSTPAPLSSSSAVSSLRPTTPPKPGPKSPGSSANEAASKTNKSPGVGVALKPPSFPKPQVTNKSSTSSSTSSSSSTTAQSPTESRVPPLPTSPSQKSSAASNDGDTPDSSSAIDQRRPSKFAALRQGFEANNSSSSSSSSTKPTVSSQNATKGVAADNHVKQPLSLPSSPTSKDSSITLRNNSTNSDAAKQQRTSSIIVERRKDGKRFKKVKLRELPPEEKVVDKPEVPTDVDLSAIQGHYQSAIKEFQKESDAANAVSPDEEDDADIYDDCFSVEHRMLPRKSTFRKQSERISLIPEMGPEEEGLEEDDGLVYDDGMTPMPGEDIYDDAMTVKPPDEDDGDVYEDEESLALAKVVIQEEEEEESEQDRKKRLKKEEEARKKEEKERKEREREEERKRKKEEKERQNKEKEEKRLRDRFKLTGDEISVGEGVIMQDAKGKGDNLTVKKGQMVNIIRMDQNPVNKWLVKIENTSYVDSSIIEVNAANIKQTMVKDRKTSSASLGSTEELDGQTYDLVPTEDDGDIYEPLD
ncbi:protein split ends isoform X2 [Aplysia californica]|uniref:Protein split ends isoform X2 n=1 Tax=Aplysia californica TaxID=6500 RepID=A0ABM1VYM0_APLCA|nr:protein split ends isoform X2 [Aplysia californica]